MPQLKELTVTHCRMTEAGIAALLQMAGQKVTSLYLYQYKFAGHGLEVLALKFPQLEKLFPYGCRSLTDAGLKEFLLMPGEKLAYLEFARNNFTGEGLTGLGLKFPLLEMLQLSYCTSLTDVGLKEFSLMPGEELAYVDLPGNWRRFDWVGAEISSITKNQPLIL